jgi:Sulfotransferase family
MSARTRRYPTGDELIATAMQKSGLTDFGPGDFRDGLDNLLASLERDGDLDPAADSRVIDDLLRRLVNRLEVEAWYRSHPEIERLPVSGPVDINGLPRTGTTALANMMSLDPQFRCLRGWEQTSPCPPPTIESEADDPRRIAAAKSNEQLPPEAKALHLYDLDATMEDTELLGMAFHGQGYTLPVFSYHAWWRHADLVPTYQYHRRVVKLLQSQRPPNLWLFKAPHHMFHLEAIVAAYPDVRFVMTHRDPAKVVPSYVSTVNMFFPRPDGERDMRRLGREVSEHLRDGMQNTIAARDRLGEERFIDVHHRELVADPFGTVRRVYEFLELPLHEAVVQSLTGWQQRNQPGAHGMHRYTAEQFGLDVAQIRRDYDFYIHRFGVTVES